MTEHSQTRKSSSARWNALHPNDDHSPLIVPREDLHALQTDATRYCIALEKIERHFLPGDHKSLTYSSDARGMLTEIRDTVREALGPVGCPCVGTSDQEDCPHE